MHVRHPLLCVEAVEAVVEAGVLRHAAERDLAPAADALLDEVEVRTCATSSAFFGRFNSVLTV